MNGDGLQDIVHIRRGDLAYWAGCGNGTWGDGGSCPAGTYGDDRETVMGGSYTDMRPDVHAVFLSDVNADGLSDLLQVRFDAVDIWINVGGYEFMPRHVIDRTPAHPGFTERVRFADVDGTGTPDLLWGDAGRYT
jgi:hypothetical protein